jgi:thiosulfate/3-mercaptopyruvate sulfurtransferase
VSGGFTTLVSTQQLAAQLGDPGWVVVDCRFTLSDPDTGNAAWRRSRIPGASYLHLENDLSGSKTDISGRHPLPDPSTLTRRLGECGVRDASQVVVYDDSFGSIAARLWWMLRWLGHDAVAVLDGGFQKWQRERHPLETVHPGVHVPGEFRAEPRRSAWVDARHIELALRFHDDLLIDARAPERFAGEMEPFDPIAGHIPGAINRPWEDNLEVDGTFAPPMELREAYQAILGGRPPVRAIHACGSGVTACHNLLAMEVAGLAGSRLYPGSWSEWITDPARPVAIGEAA